MITETILKLRFDQKYKSALVNVKLPGFPPDVLQKIQDAVRESEDAKMKTFVVKCDMTSILNDLGQTYYCPPDGPLQTMRPLKAYDSAYPEPAVFSKSVAVIVWKLVDDTIFVCIIEDRNGGWIAFPAGGAKPGETIEQCACREVFEETGLLVEPPAKILAIREARGPLGESNTLFTINMKVSGDNDITIQQSEIKSATWLPIDQAIERITIRTARNILNDFKKDQHRGIIPKV